MPGCPNIDSQPESSISTKTCHRFTKITATSWSMYFTIVNSPVLKKTDRGCYRLQGKTTNEYKLNFKLGVSIVKHPQLKLDDKKEKRGALTRI